MLITLDFFVLGMHLIFGRQEWINLKKTFFYGLTSLLILVVLFEDLDVFPSSDNIESGYLSMEIFSIIACSIVNLGFEKVFYSIETSKYPFLSISTTFTFFLIIESYLVN